MRETRAINDRIAAEIDALVELAEAAGQSELAADLLKMHSASRSLAEQLSTLLQRAQSAQGVDALREIRHDLRTPVNQIKGYCELLQEEVGEAEDSPAQLEAGLARLHAQTELLEQQIEELATRVAGGPESKFRRRPSGPMSTAAVAPRRDASERHGTVLVVDDHAVNRELLARVLQRDGYNVLKAGDGREGLEVLDRESVDVVLLDILMPEMDGYEALERLKADENLKHIPVIMLTSLDEHSSVTRCIEAGAEDHLPKPFDPVLLRARIDSSMERKRSRDRERQYLEQIVAAKKRADDLLHGVIPLGVALSQEREESKLLARVLGEARRFCGADGGVIYLRQESQLVPMQTQVASLDIDETSGSAVGLGTVATGQDDCTQLRPVATAACREETISLTRVPSEDVASKYDLSGFAAFDAAHDYVCESLLCLPLRAGDDVVGVLELWNATDPSDGSIVAFEEQSVEILESLSLLAAAALDAYRRESELRQQIRRLEIRIDESNQRSQVSEITETDYFRRLREEAKRLRKDPA
jgi:CheY-like chemotaxis protein